MSPTHTAPLRQLHADWQVNPEHTQLTRAFSFDNFYATMAFVNALAWIAHQTDHHPDLAIGYNYCHVTFTTHTLNALSDNDFMCAAKVDELTRQL